MVFLIHNELDYEHKEEKSYLDYIKFCEGTDLMLCDSYCTLEKYKKYKGLGHSTYSYATNMVLSLKEKRMGLLCYHPDHGNTMIDKMT